MQTYDDRQVEWIVKPTDTAKKEITALSKHHVEVVVLPRTVYLGQGLPESLPPVPAADDPDLHYKLRERDCLFLLGVTKEA